MSTRAEFHVPMAKRGDLAIAKAGLDSDEQQRPIPLSDPCIRIRRCHKGLTLFFSQEFHGPTLVPFRWNRQNALAVQRQCWLADGYVSEKGVQCREAVVSCPDAVAAAKFKVFEKLPQEGRIEIFHAQFGR